MTNVVKYGACLLLAAMCVPDVSAQASARSGRAALLQRAKVLRSQHKVKEGVALLEPYVVAHADDEDALALLGELRLDSGDASGAAQEFTKALAVSPNAAGPNEQMGLLLLSQKRYPEAMDRFETVLAVAPRDVEARRGELQAATQLALGARGKGHPEVALQVFEHARERLSDDAQLLLELGIEATELRAYPKAAEALERALTLAPDDPSILYALARLEVEEQHMQDAEKHFRAYLTQKPSDASAHFGLGHVFAMEQRVDEARAEFQRSVQLQPVQTESYYQLGQIELDAHHDDAAKPLFEKTLGRDPRHGGALAGMGIIAFRAKNDARAEEYLKQAAEASPDYQPARYYHGLVLNRLGRKAEAEVELHAATELAKAQQGSPSLAQ